MDEVMRKEHMKSVLKGLSEKVIDTARMYNMLTPAEVLPHMTVEEIRDKTMLAIHYAAEENGWDIPDFRIHRFTGEVYQFANGNIPTEKNFAKYEERVGLHVFELLGKEFPTQKTMYAQAARDDSRV